jgi:ketosteroid isomerase-like protein
MPETADVARLREIQQELAEAWATRDRATIERLIAPDWVVTHIAGQRLTRTEVFEMMFGSDVTQTEPSTVDEVDVRVFGDAAVVTGRTRARGTQSGVPYDITLRFTDVFMRRAGQWQAVASHATQIGRRDLEVRV